MNLRFGTGTVKPCFQVSSNTNGPEWRTILHAGSPTVRVLISDHQHWKLNWGDLNSKNIKQGFYWDPVLETLRFLVFSILIILSVSVSLILPDSKATQSNKQNAAAIKASTATLNMNIIPHEIILTNTPRPFMTRPLLVIPLIRLRRRCSRSLAFLSVLARLFVDIWRSPLYKKRLGGTSGISSAFIFVIVTSGCSSPSSATSPSSASDWTCPDPPPSPPPPVLFLLQTQYSLYGKFCLEVSLGGHAVA